MALIDLIDEHIAPAGLGIITAGIAGAFAAYAPDAMKYVGVATFAGLSACMFLFGRPEKGYLATIQTYLRRRAHEKRQNEDIGSRLPAR